MSAHRRDGISWVRPWLAMTLAAALSACGGGAAEPSDPAARAQPLGAQACTEGCSPSAVFSVAFSSPADRAHGVSRTVRPQITFTLPVDPASVRGGAVTLQRVGGRSVGAQSYLAGSVLSAVPSQKLLPFADYAIGLDSALTGSNGEPLFYPAKAVFTTADAQWRAPVLVHDGAQQSINTFVIARLGSQDAFAAWQSGDEPGIRVSRYSAADGGWGPPQLISGEPGIARDPQLAVGANGAVVLAWSHLNTASPRYSVIWATRFSRGTGQWEAPRVVSHADGSSNTVPRIAVGEAGEAVVAWRRSDAGVGDSVWYSRNWPTTGPSWQTPSRADDPAAPAGPIGSVAVGLSPQLGRLVLAWSARLNTVNTLPVIWARAFGTNLPQGSQGARVISNTNGDPRVEPQVAVDGAGTAHVAWRQYGPGPTAYPTFSNVQVASFGSFGWEPAIWMSNLHAGARHVRIASNRVGGGAQRTWLTWVEPGMGDGQVWAAQLRPDGVGPVGVIGGGATLGFHSASLVVDDAGNALVAWTTNVDGERVKAARFGGRTGLWSAPQVLDDPAHPGTPYGVSLSVDSSGDAQAAWVPLDLDSNGRLRTPMVTRRFD